jgi:hypothetical protein
MMRTASGGETVCIDCCAVAFSCGEAGAAVDPRRPRARGSELRAGLHLIELRRGEDKQAGVGYRLVGPWSGHTEGCVMADLKAAGALLEELA